MAIDRVEFRAKVEDILGDLSLTVEDQALKITDLAEDMSK